MSKPEKSAQAGKPDTERWVDPLTPVERWFTRLPNTEMSDESCHCGSGLPVVYWSREDGTACRACKSFLHVYIPHAVLWNVLEKFGIQISAEDRKTLFSQVADLADSDDAGIPENPEGA